MGMHRAVGPMSRSSTSSCLPKISGKQRTKQDGRLRFAFRHGSPWFRVGTFRRRKCAAGAGSSCGAAANPRRGQRGTRMRRSAPAVRASMRCTAVPPENCRGHIGSGSAAQSPADGRAPRHADLFSRTLGRRKVYEHRARRRSLSTQDVGASPARVSHHKQCVVARRSAGPTAPSHQGVVVLALALQWTSG